MSSAITRLRCNRRISFYARQGIGDQRVSLTDKGEELESVGRVGEGGHDLVFEAFDAPLDSVDARGLRALGEPM
ncbi:hypothetical protein ACW9HQ_32805 [Nocardia gipuzkoensis]